MRIVDINAARGTPSDVVHAVRRGDEVLLLDGGHPVARVVPIRFRRTPGSAKGLFTVPDGFHAPAG